MHTPLQWIRIALVVSAVVVDIDIVRCSGQQQKQQQQKQQQQQQQQQRAGWNPRDDHPCTVETISASDFLRAYGKQGGLPPLYPRPLVIASNSYHNHKGATSNSNSSNDNNSSNNSKQTQTQTHPTNRNHRLRELTRSDTILDSFPANFTVTLSSSNSFSEHRRTVPLAQYLDEVATGPPQNASTKSNETWYLFGETHSREWKDLLREYELPPCRACQRGDDNAGRGAESNRNRDDLVALSFGIGNSGSGVSWHVHGPGFSEAIHGRKHWVLYPFENKPNYSPDQTSLNWMHTYYNDDDDESDRPLECTLHPGDLIYFPDMWWHATINIDDYTAFVSTFTQEHLFVQRSETKGLPTRRSWA